MVIRYHAFPAQVVGNPKAKRTTKKNSEDDESESQEEEDSSDDEEETEDKDEEMDHDGEKSEDEQEDEEIPETPVDVPAKLTFLPVEENIRDRSVTDIRAFKDKLKLYQIAKLF